MKRTLALLALSLVCEFCRADVNVGQEPPGYLGMNFQDETVAVSRFKGKVLIVTFWATWCGPCRTEMAVLENIQHVAGPADLAIVAVNFNEGERMWQAMKAKLSGMELMLTRDNTQRVTSAYNVKTIPHMFMIDRSGHVAAIHSGYGGKDLDGIVEEINRLLAPEKAP
jgi:thiol-disulfide isomerase/thioredoxin